MISVSFFVNSSLPTTPISRFVSCVQPRGGGQLSFSMTHGFVVGEHLNHVLSLAGIWAPVSEKFNMTKWLAYTFAILGYSQDPSCLRCSGSGKRKTLAHVTLFCMWVVSKGSLYFFIIWYLSARFLEGTQLFSTWSIGAEINHYTTPSVVAR